ncbi:MAG: hypothetical protein HFG41_07625 [Coprococcus sp.]|nr:hypothetical protein [Coprococcus sp.]
MNKKLFIYTIVGVIFTSAAGFGLHFAYEYSGKNPVAAMFSPVGESVWEHMKLVFFPSLLYYLIGWGFFFRSFPAFFRSSLAAALTGTLAVPVIFYAYSGMIGKHFLALDIATFFLCVVITFSLSYQLTIQNTCIIPTPLLVFLVVLLMICFFIFTYSPPNVALFFDPSSEQAVNSIENCRISSKTSLFSNFRVLL